MKTIVAIAVTLALLASPGYAVNDYTTEDYLVALYEERTGLDASADVVAKAASIADVAHAGEIWTQCDSWFQSCSVDDPAGSAATCQGSVPAHWAAYAWISAPGVVGLGEGIHITWTEAHAGGALVGGHSSGTVAGTSCVVDFFGLILTYHNGAASFS